MSLTSDSSTSHFNDDVVNQFINEGQQVILQSYNWPWHKTYDTSTITTVISTQEYSLPSDFMRLVDQTVYWDGGDLDNNILLEKVDETARFDFDSSNTGNPSKYWVRYDEDNTVFKIGFEPTPNEAQEVYFQYVATMTDLNDTTNTTSKIPAEWHYILPWYAAARLLEMDEDVTQSQRYQKRFEGHFSRMQKAYRSSFVHSSLPGF